MANTINISSASARLETDNQGRPVVIVALTFGSNEIEFTIHQSLAYADTLNVEVDGDFTTTPGLRLNLNDGLIYDSTTPGGLLGDDREPTLEDPDTIV